jgi:hypothetical protein
MILNSSGDFWIFTANRNNHWSMWYQIGNWDPRRWMQILLFPVRHGKSLQKIRANYVLNCYWREEPEWAGHVTPLHFFDTEIVANIQTFHSADGIDNSAQIIKQSLCLYRPFPTASLRIWWQIDRNESPLTAALLSRSRPRCSASTPAPEFNINILSPRWLLIFSNVETQKTYFEVSFSRSAKQSRAKSHRLRVVKFRSRAFGLSKNAANRLVLLKVEQTGCIVNLLAMPEVRTRASEWRFNGSDVRKNPASSHIFESCNHREVHIPKEKVTGGNCLRISACEPYNVSWQLQFVRWVAMTLGYE